MNIIDKPMLAATVDNLNQIVLPAFVQDKIDGIRCYMTSDIGYSRTAKPLPNLWIQRHLRASMLPDGLDGEIITLKEDGTYDSYNDVQSKVMTKKGEPQFHYIVFDLNSNWTYRQRYRARVDYVKLHAVRQWLKCVHELYIETYEGLEHFERDAVENRKQEGIIIRSPMGFYKHGRSTIQEQALLKLKRMHDDEAVVMGFTELMHNCNAAGEDSFGYTERSSHKDNMEGGNKLGALICKCPSFEEFFQIGSGFTDYQRQDIWDNKIQYLGKTLTFKHQKYGAKDKPRIPIFKGWRND